MNDLQNIVLTNMTKAQREWLEKQAKKKSLTVTGFIKFLAETGIENDKENEND